MRRTDDRDLVPAPQGWLRRIRLIGVLAALTLALTLAVGPARAAHTMGTLDCGAAGTYAVDGQLTSAPGVEGPGPWSGVFLLEGTTKVFRALTIEGQVFPFNRPAAARFPGPVVTCTLSSPGPQIPVPWTLTGVFTGA